MRRGFMSEKKEYQSFFAIITIGLEELALSELKRKTKLYSIELKDIEVTRGGISFKVLEDNQAYQLNHILRIPTRIIKRIAEFKARDFPKLYNKFLKIEWNNYIPGKLPEVKFSAKESKIFDSRKVEKTLHDAIKKYQIGQPPKKKDSQKVWTYTPTIFIRSFQDNFVVSIDTSGDRIDKRGYKTLTTKAPMRESLAAGMYEFWRSKRTKEVSQILDPMCGSGTLLLEFNNYDQLNYHRHFSYIDFPKVQVKKIRKETQSLFSQIRVNDIDNEVIEVAKKNLIQLSEVDIEATTGDFKGLENIKDQTLVVINPPYNKRIKTEEDIHSFINTMVKKFLVDLKIDQLLFILPETIRFQKKYQNYRLEVSSSISNGGIMVKFYFFERN